jgi:phosphatidyl-myo-inositol dimannoside synthase
MAPAESSSRPVLLVTNDLGPRAGGIETFILGLLEQLNGREIVIYTSSQLGSHKFDQELNERLGVVVIRDKSRVLLPTPRVISNIKRVMRSHGTKTVWFGASAPLGWMAPNLRKAGARRVIGMTHGHEVWWSKVIPFRYAMRRIGNSTDILTYLGDFTRGAMASAVGSKAQLVQIAPGINVEHFTPTSKPSDLIAKYQIGNRPTIISVGRLVHRKGQDRLIQALPQIKKAIPNVVLVIVGEGPRGRYLRDLVTKLDLQENVIFVGRVSYEDLPKYLNMADIFAMPSRSRFFGLEVEGLGIVYLEASACGLPVIAGDSGGAPDAVLIGETGFVVGGNDLAAISKTAIELLSDPVLMDRLGKRGREWAVSDWNWNSWGLRFAQLLKG